MSIGAARLPIIAIVTLPALFVWAAAVAAPLVIVFLLHRYIKQSVRMSGIKG